MNVLGRGLIAVGVLLIVAGGAVLLAGRLNLPLGRLPGDFTWRGRGWVVSFPLMTSLLVSLLLSLVLWLAGRLRH
ncbi:MAG TPA: DUF2905 domain-containing protein [Granulicella sp.]